ncbi:MAG: hypothetical protein JWR84_511 [Caulobacter sp.]|nr:hypothetical protein [Caulobacter sp.]
MTWAQRIARVRFWWTDNGAAFGVPVAVVVIGAVI